MGYEEEAKRFQEQREKDLTRWTDLLKSEFSAAAERYENIYKALWQNFNYMAVLAAGVLAFGKEQLGLSLSALAASVIFAAWYWISFEPLNHYGTRHEDRLRKVQKRIECAMNARTNPLGEFKFEVFGVIEGKPHRYWGHVVKWVPLFCPVALIGLWWWARDLKRATWYLSFIVGALLTVGTFWWFYWGDRDSTGGGFTPRLRVRNSVRMFAVLLHCCILVLLLQVGPDWGIAEREKAEAKTKKYKVMNPLIAPTAVPLQITIWPRPSQIS